IIIRCVITTLFRINRIPFPFIGLCYIWVIGVDFFGRRFIFTIVVFVVFVVFCVIIIFFSVLICFIILCLGSLFLLRIVRFFCCCFIIVCVFFCIFCCFRGRTIFSSKIHQYK